MEKIRIDLVKLKTEEDALKRFGRLKGMPADYNSELESFMVFYKHGTSH